MIGLSMPRVPGDEPLPPRAVGLTSLALALALAFLAGGAGACASPPGTLLILQDQIPVPDSTTGICAVTADSSDPSRASGRLDVDLDRPYSYYVYPLIQNLLPSIQTIGGVESNMMLLRSVRVDVKAPAGVDPGWAAGCPGTFDAPATGVLVPGSTRAVEVEALRICHAERLRQLIANGQIPGDLSQPVYFTLELTAIADRSGSEQKSSVFPFEVQVCAGCLQSMFPLVPACADAPKPNPLHGNPCNIGQDGPTILCCTNPAGALICPAPDA